MIDGNRANVILTNILTELYDKTFDMNTDEFNSWLETELGMTKEEINDMNIGG